MRNARTSQWFRHARILVNVSWFAIAGSAAALDVVWVGGQGTWEDAGRWLPSVVPNSTAFNVFIDDGLAATSYVTLSTGQEAGSLSIGSGDTLALGAGANLGVAGNMLVGGVLDVSNGASLFLSGETENRIEGGGRIVARIIGTTGLVVFIRMNDKPLVLGVGTSLQAEERGMAIVGQAIAATPFINRGSVSAVGAGALMNIYNPKRETGGSWEARDGGALVFSGDYKTTDLDTSALRNDTGYVLFSGRQDNRGQELFLDGAGTYGFRNSLVRGGTLRWAPETKVSVSKGYQLTDAGAIIVDFGGHNEWVDVTLASDLDIENGALSVRDTFTLNSRLTLRDGWLRAPDATGAVRLDGLGEIAFDAGTNRVTGGWGLGSTLTIGPDITIRTGSGSGTLEGLIDNEGVISAETPGAFITLSRYAQWRNMASGVMRARNGGTLELCCDLTTAQLQSGTIRNEGGRVLLSGTLDNRQAELLLDASTGSWTLGRFSTIKGGDLRWTNGATLELEGGTFSDVIVHSDLTLGAQRTLILEGATRIGTHGAPVQFVNEGRLLVLGLETDIEVHAAGQWAVAASGSIEVWSGATVRAYSPMTISGSLLIQDGGLLELMSAVSFEQVAGTVAVDGILAGEQIQVTGGELVGGGTVRGHLFNGALLEPGGATGVLTVDGTFVQSDHGLLEIELGGSGTGEFESMVVTGAITVDGTVLLVRREYYMPTVGDAFAILRFSGARAGNFRDIRTQGFDPGVQFESQWRDGLLSVAVVAVPEPGHWALQSIGLIAIIGRTMRRRRDRGQAWYMS